MILTPLDATLTKGAFVTPLSSTLTRPSRKNIKTRDFNSISCHTYEGALHKSFRCHTYKKGVGGGERFLRGPICSARALFASVICESRPLGTSPDSIGRGGGYESPMMDHKSESRSEPRRMHKAVVNVLGRALECSGRSISALCEERW